MKCVAWDIRLYFGSPRHSRTRRKYPLKLPAISTISAWSRILNVCLTSGCPQVTVRVSGAFNSTIRLPITIGSVPYRPPPPMGYQAYPPQVGGAASAPPPEGGYAASAGATAQPYPDTGKMHGDVFMFCYPCGMVRLSSPHLGVAASVGSFWNALPPYSPAQFIPNSCGLNSGHLLGMPLNRCLPREHELIKLGCIARGLIDEVEQGQQAVTEWA